MRVLYYDPNLFIVIHFKLFTHLCDNLNGPRSWCTVSIMTHSNTSSLLFLHLLAFKGMKVHRILICFYLSYPPPVHLVFLLPPDTFLFGTSSTVNFTVELSEVLSVVIVLVFNYEYFNLHILGILASLLLAGNLIDCFCFLSFVCWKDFLYSVHEHSDIIYSLEKTHLHLGKCVCFFKSKKKKKTTTKETRLENTSRLYKDSAVLD